MFRTKTKRLLFASLSLFLFLNILAPVAYALNLPGDDNGIIPPDNGIVDLPSGQNPSDPANPTGGSTTTNNTSTPSTTDNTSTPSTTTTTGGSTSGTGLVQCGNEGQAACTFNDLFTTAGRVIDFVLNIIVPALAVFGIVMAAIIMITSGGDPGKFTQGKNAMIAIAIGLLIIYLSWFIVKSFIQFLGGGATTLQFFK